MSTLPYDHEYIQTLKESTIHHVTYGTLTNRISTNSATKSRNGSFISDTFNEVRHLIIEEKMIVN